jgi:hypothetical protein
VKQKAKADTNRPLTWAAQLDEQAAPELQVAAVTHIILATGARSHSARLDEQRRMSSEIPGRDKQVAWLGAY